MGAPIDGCLITLHTVSGADGCIGEETFCVLTGLEFENPRICETPALSIYPDDGYPETTIQMVASFVQPPRLRALKTLEHHEIIRGRFFVSVNAGVNEAWHRRRVANVPPCLLFCLTHACPTQVSLQGSAVHQCWAARRCTIRHPQPFPCV